MSCRTPALILPLALLLAACSPNPAPAGSGDDLAPAPARAAANQTAQQLEVMRLQSQHWRLQAATDSAGKRIEALFARADAPVTLDFNGDRVAVANTCNRMGGTFALKDGALTLGPMASTEMACSDPAVMALDSEIGKRLQGTLKASLDADGNLRVLTAGDELLVFAPEPTAETRFGGPGDTVFLEVAAQTQACPHPLIRDKQCLQVRELHYDAAGLRQGDAGNFSNFYDAIEGYTHEAGVRNVLRVKRFKVANPPADASSQAYVLDMVVESAVER